MDLRYLFMLIFASTISGNLIAQETATKVSDFNYGIAGENIITSVHSVDGQLYANLFQFYGDQAAGLLSTINETTGAATPVLDPNQTQWFGGETRLDQPAVFAAGGMVFGLQRDRASGNNLYRLDGPEPVLLHSANDMNFTRPVMLGDSLYFLTGSLPLRQQAGATGEVLAELWRTDGTLAGTQLVAPLLSFITAESINLVAGENKLLIGIMDDGDQIFYVYEPGGAGLGLVGEGFGQFIINAPRFITHFNPIAYHNGGFYVYEAQDFSNEEANLYRIDEATIEIEELTLPVLPGNNFLDNEYNQLEFQSFRNELYLFAGRKVGDNGNDLYRIGGDAGLTLQPIRNEILTETELFEDYSNVAIVADTMYYLSRQAGDSLSVFAYEGGEDTPRELTSFFHPNSTFFLAADERFVYVSVPDRSNGLLVRVDKQNGDKTVIDINFNSNSFAFRSSVPPIAVTDDGAYLVGNESTDGLLVLPVDGDALQPVGNFLTLNGRRNPFNYGADSVRNELLLFSGSRQVYNGGSDAFQSVSFPVNIDSSSIRRYAILYGETYYYLIDTLRHGRVMKLTDGEFSELPLSSNLNFDPTNYNLSLGNSLNDNIRQTTFDPGTGDPQRLLLATVEADSLRLSAFLPTDFEEVIRPEFSNSTLYAIAVDTGNDREILVFNFAGEERYRFNIPFSAAIRELTLSGAFVETVNDESFTFEPSMSFFPADGSAAQVMAFDNATNAYFNRNFYEINGRLLFVGDTRDLGREWLVADPTTGSVKVLKDINPGRGFSTETTLALMATDNGLYFTANDGVNGNELWYTDGTEEGTIMLPEINPGPDSANPNNLIRVDSTFFFSANGPSGYELYRLHLRDNVPELIIDLHEGEGDSHPNSFIRVGEDFYFFGRETVGSTYELYRIAYELVPTEAEPTRLAARIYPNPVRNLPVTVEAPEGEEFQRLQVFNQQGQLLFEAAANGSKTDFDLSDLPAGTYWLRTWYASGRFSINAVQRVK